MMLFQRNMLYPGRGLAPVAIPSGVAANAEKIWIVTSFGKVEGRLVLGNTSIPQPAVIFFHGNGELIDNLTPELDKLRKLGFAILLVEYPGYGASSGRPQERTIAESAIAAYDMLLKRSDIDPSRIVSFGFSIGAGPAVALAVERPVKALVLAAPVASLRPFANKRLLPSFFLHDTFDNALIIKRYKGPVLVLHGRGDTVVPFYHGEKVAASAVKGRLVQISADHNELLDSPLFWQELTTFFKQEKLVDGQKQ